MLDLNDIALFVQVVRSGSFAEAARRLGVPSNTVSRRVQGLEEHLGTRLLQRSTRKLTLTNAGLAITATQRSPLLPEVPTTAEVGMPKLNFAAWLGVLAPAGTPAPIADALNKVLVESVQSPDGTLLKQAAHFVRLENCLAGRWSRPIPPPERCACSSKRARSS
jgi:hypothetical protein